MRPQAALAHPYIPLQACAFVSACSEISHRQTATQRYNTMRIPDRTWTGVADDQHCIRSPSGVRRRTRERQVLRLREPILRRAVPDPHVRAQNRTR